MNQLVAVEISHGTFVAYGVPYSASITVMFTVFGEETYCMHTHTSTLDRYSFYTYSFYTMHQNVQKLGC